MAYPSLEIGQKVWIHRGGQPNSLVEGKVVHSFRLDGYSYDMYVIEFPNHIESTFEVREWATVSLTKKGPINMWTKKTLLDTKWLT